MNIKIILLIILIALIGAYIFWFKQEFQKQTDEITDDIATQLKECLPMSDQSSHEKCERLLNSITNFEECVSAGFSIMKSNPEQCAIPNGKVFVRETNSTWEMAVKAINNCEVEKIWQTHSKVVTLILKNGSKYIQDQ